MDDYTTTRSFLETLSTDDLSRKAESLGIDLPPDLNRVFVIEEILDALQEDEDPEEQELEESETDEAQAPEEKPLPDYYNATFLEVLIRDPLWAFVFWEVRQIDKDQFEKASQFEGYFLRVSSVPYQAKKTDESFVISVDPLDTAWYVCFPSQKGWFKVELCVQTGNSEQVLAASQPIKIPSCPGPDLYSENTTSLKGILDLSGMGQLKIIRSEERRSRLPQRCE